MKTITIQIGNTDNKLTQEEWSNFVRCVKEAIEYTQEQIHFFGGSSSFEKWQNACWVFCFSDFSLSTNKDKILIKELQTIKAAYKQDSIAHTEGDTLFI